VVGGGHARNVHIGGSHLQQQQQQRQHMAGVP
jgi:hypothetical protein